MNGMMATTDKQGETDAPHRTQQRKHHAHAQLSCWDVCVLQRSRVSAAARARRQTNNKQQPDRHNNNRQQSSRMTACVMMISIIILHK
jgi:uncharacterized membrane protein YidH (DUF202 family)